jgi:hypothetical protein
VPFQNIACFRSLLSRTFGQRHGTIEHSAANVQRCTYNP